MKNRKFLRFASIVLQPSDPPSDFAALAVYARRIENAGFTTLLVADGTASAGAYEPLTLLSALAALTDRIGLVATVTTDFNEPFHVARRLASLDHISGGRAGWSVDVGAVPWQAGGFFRGEDDVKGSPNGRAEEFLLTVKHLWDSYADDAIVADKRSGLYFHPGGRRPLDHVGAHFRVAGPLNLSRPPQGHPVIFHRASTPADFAFAGKHADVVLTGVRTIEDALAYRSRLDEALIDVGRVPGSVSVWPTLTPIVAATEAEAKERQERLRGLRPSRKDDTGELFIVGTVAQASEWIAEWFVAGAADGFAVRFPPIPGEVDPFLDGVLPRLARRGLFTPPTGGTLRDFLGLSYPERSVS